MGTPTVLRRFPFVFVILAGLGTMAVVSSTHSQERDSKIRSGQVSQTSPGKGATEAAQEKQKDAENAQKQAQAKEQLPSEAPAPPLAAAESALAPPPAVTPTTPGTGFSSLAPPSAEALRATPGQSSTLGAPSAQGAPGTQAPIIDSTDVGSFLRKSESFTGIETQRRSPIANETRIRGFHLGEIVTQADGAYWFPARQDLDTFLSKIDSGSIRNVVVLKGPYSAHYGPGFAFIDTTTLGAPFSPSGFDWHGRTLFSYNFNGQQLYGRQDVGLGDPKWAVLASYGQRIGNEYETGDDVRMPSRYNVRDVEAVIGYKPTPDSTIEFGYMRLDQTGLEFPGQIFDTEFLVTNAYRLRYTVEHQELFDRFVVEGFYNRTSMAGNAQNPEVRALIPQLNLLHFIGFTDIDQASSGYRAAVSWGEEKCNQLTLGTDFRYLDGQLNEHDQLFQIPCFSLTTFGVPRSHHSTVGGLFAEDVLPANDQLVIRAGGRVDWVNTDIDQFPPGQSCSDLQAFFGTHDFERNYTLFLAYLTGEYKLCKEWSVTGGFGHAERAPTTTELYAIEPFLAVLQNGFTTVVGNPGLTSEKLYQIDLGIKADYERVRLGVNGFYAWINDYITYEALNTVQSGIKIPEDVSNALTVRFVNTGLATLAGFELYGEADATDWLTPFATMSFVEGRDQTRDSRGEVIFRFGQPVPGLGKLGSPQEPLPGIAPLDSRVGLRFHEPRQVPRYGLEAEARLVAPQNRVATSLNEVKSAGFTIYNLRSFWQVRRGILLTAGVENLFDRNYREHLDLRTGFGTFQPGISPYLGVEMRY
jgi:outer membrane receptor protein involved in Fe transport